MRSSAEIREHFRELLNQALPRLGMFGGEIAAYHLFSELAFIEEREAEFDAHIGSLRSRGAYTASGVLSAFPEHTHLPATDNEIGSVYAEIAFRMGYLDTVRILDRNQFKCLCSDLSTACQSRDFTTQDIVEAYGVPSWSAGTNPLYPCGYLYLCNEVEQGAIALDFWNVLQFSENRQSVSGEFGDLPILRNVRMPATTFGQGFLFTPIGRRITGRD